MELRQLAAFLAVARTGTITAAATELDLAPSSLSEQVRALERSLDAQLFHRTPTGMRLSDQGRSLLPHARLLLTQAEQARQAVASGSRRVRVGTLETLAASHLPSVLAALADHHPDLTVQVRTMPRTALLTGLTEGELDAALLLDLGPVLGDLGFTPPVPRTQLSFVDLAPVPLALVAAPGHPACALGVLTAAQLAAQRLLVTEPGCSFFLALRHLVTDAADLVELRSLGTMRAWAAQGLGVALLPEFTVAEDLAASRLVRLPLRGSPPELCLRLVWPADREATDPDLKRVLYALSG